ncbi:DUF2252 domain-containing protein [Chitinophaga pendula]|uniref:DUF2252 domain-containing protein n=1 Tax=Chitinophaga TaxID=79328 RepID=UPI000BB0C747|nr:MULTISPECIES: DUF2252 family protein [Chitinophaga]ASZ13278.1 hypothetical protein CK934_21100 [Chitinophaga sp. MD30]UCJ09097.1 DUF2252 domain-containing protein [Chitinophaga pendula]
MTIADKIWAFNQDRYPTTVSRKYALLRQSAFRFFRGTCHLFYEELAQKISWEDPTKAWICGDLHLENFGSYKGDNGLVYFDMNDFDEALLAPATWELVRMLTSIYIASDELAFRQEDLQQLSHTYLDTYRQVMQQGKAMVIEKETSHGLLKFFLEQVALRRHKTFIQSRIITRKKQSTLLIDNEKTLALNEPDKTKIKQLLDKALARWRPDITVQTKDVAIRIAGTGSVGLLRYVALVYNQTNDKFHLLDIKEARTSSLSPYVSIRQPAWPDQATRIITLQQRVQHVSPAMLHTLPIDNRSFVVKTLQPTQDRMDLTLCKRRPERLADILKTMAIINASGQLRASGRQKASNADALIQMAENRHWVRPLLQYVKAAGKKVQQDYTAYCKAYDTGFFNSY